MHPALAPMIERNAFVGGCDGVAVTKSAELIDADPTGTIPHSLVLMIGDTVEALKAFHDVIDPKVRRVALIDTLQDEKFEAIRDRKSARLNSSHSQISYDVFCLKKKKKQEQ